MLRVDDISWKGKISAMLVALIQEADFKGLFNNVNHLGSNKSVL